MKKIISNPLAVFIISLVLSGICFILSSAHKGGELGFFGHFGYVLMLLGILPFIISMIKNALKK